MQLLITETHETYIYNWAWNSEEYACERIAWLVFVAHSRGYRGHLNYSLWTFLYWVLCRMSVVRVARKKTRRAHTVTWYWVTLKPSVKPEWRRYIITCCICTIYETRYELLDFLTEISQMIILIRFQGKYPWKISCVIPQEVGIVARNKQQYSDTRRAVSSHLTLEVTSKLSKDTWERPVDQLLA
jgi:hypothetical protein